MGNSAAGSNSWFFTEEATLVLLRLHDIRSVGLAPGEEVQGVVSLGSDATSGVACVRKNEPVTVPIGTAGTTLNVEFQATCDPGGVLGARVLGSITLPLEHIAKRCGGSLYYMWLPLETQMVQPAHSGDSSGSTAQSLEQFDRAMRTAARDPRLPLVCVSLCQADSPQAERERYEFNAEAGEKALRFYGLLQSHAQHSRLLQALYRQSRSGRTVGVANVDAGMPPQLRDALVDSWATVGRSTTSTRLGDAAFGSIPELFTPEACATPASDAGSGLLLPGSATQAEESSRLRLDIETTTKEANVRINQASEAIRTLKERLAAKQAEHERLRKETARVLRDTDALENENEQLRLQLERRARECGSPADRDEEARRLKREADVLGEQKAALVLILEDLYGAVGPRSEGSSGGRDSREPAPVAVMPTGRSPGDTLGMLQEVDTGEAWTNLLPRPSELFASSSLLQQDMR